MMPHSHPARTIPASLLALLLVATLTLPAQQPAPAHLDDPANLAGERVAPQDLADDLPINHGAPALQQLLRKLRTRASFMLIVAHPDDEDGGLLTYLSRGQGARVAMLTLNRGEGGQNLMSADFDDALGLIRTQELLAAGRYMGVDQLFGTEVDFGFSKTKEEAFAKWTHDRVLYDAVRAIRLYRPLVIASVFIGAPSDGHGQHQVSGEIAQEAFKAAGDPTVFPDQIAQGLEPWQPLKVYARSPFARIDTQGMYDYAVSAYVPPSFTNYVTGKVTTTVPKANVVIPEGNTDPLLGGLSYVQFARQGLGLQRSQIGNGIRTAGPGRADVSYHRYGSKLNQPDGDDSPLETSLFDGIDTSIVGMAVQYNRPAFKEPLAKISALIDQAANQYDPAHPEGIAATLREALKQTDELLQFATIRMNGFTTDQFSLLHELRIKRVQLNNALILAHGITLQATLANPVANQSLLTTQPQIEVKTTFSNGAEPADIQNIDLHILGKTTKTKSSFGSLQDPAHTRLRIPLHLPPGVSAEDTLRVLVDSELPPTRPYFSRPNIEQAYYDVADPALRNAPSTPPPLTASLTLDDHGVTLTLTAIVADSSDSKPRQAAVFVPPVSVSLPVSAAVVPVLKHDFLLSYSAFNSESLKAPKFHLEIPPLWSYTLPPELNPPHLTPPPSGRNSRETALVRTVDPIAYRPYDINVVAELDDRDYHEGFRTVGYPGLTSTNFYTPAVFHVAAVDLEAAPNLNVAYLPGTGDDVAAYLPALGVHPHIITVADLNLTTLSKYDAVILGVRAYTAHPELAGKGSQPLLDYAAAGGVVIVQYNNSHFGDAEAPFPITTPASSGDHAHDVVEESQPVAILAPANPLLSWPNQITRADFNNWVDERGHGFAASWGPDFHPLLETHDPGQPPQLGGLLYARTGKGLYIYLGLALYRQLPAGVPGPYRLFANLISAARNPGLQK